MYIYRLRKDDERALDSFFKTDLILNEVKSIIAKIHHDLNLNTIDMSPSDWWTTLVLLQDIEPYPTTSDLQAIASQKQEGYEFIDIDIGKIETWNKSVSFIIPENIKQYILKLSSK